LGAAQPNLWLLKKPLVLCAENHPFRPCVALKQNRPYRANQQIQLSLLLLFLSHGFINFLGFDCVWKKTPRQTFYDGTRQIRVT
jgi:hypothetical protein